MSDGRPADRTPHWYQYILARDPVLWWHFETTGGPA